MNCFCPENKQRANIYIHFKAAAQTLTYFYRTYEINEFNVVTRPFKNGNINYKLSNELENALFMM